MNQEHEILFQRLVDYVTRNLRYGVRPELAAGGDLRAIVAMAATGVLHHLRVMSARQAAVLLAREANRHEGWVIREPPQYSADEIEDSL